MEAIAVELPPAFGLSFGADPWWFANSAHCSESQLFLKVFGLFCPFDITLQVYLQLLLTVTLIWPFLYIAYW